MAKSKNKRKEKFNLGFIGIGASKSGTTGVAKCLDEHPEICLSHPKEINFFNKHKIFTFGKKSTVNNYEKGLVWLKTNFKNCLDKNRIFGEFSVAYFSDPIAAFQELQKISLLLN